jgi:hypothetical protein
MPLHQLRYGAGQATCGTVLELVTDQAPGALEVLLPVVSVLCG